MIFSTIFELSTRNYIKKTSTNQVKKFSLFSDFFTFLLSIGHVFFQKMRKTPKKIILYFWTFFYVIFSAESENRGMSQFRGFLREICSENHDW